MCMLEFNILWQTKVSFVIIFSSFAKTVPFFECCFFSSSHMLIGLTEEFMNFAELTKKLLRWNKNKDLTTERDANGSTPLHFAAGLWGAGNRGSACTQVFDAATSVLYLPDNDGLSPVHVAAAAKASGAIFSPKIPIAKFVSKCPSSAGQPREHCTSPGCKTWKPWYISSSIWEWASKLEFNKWGRANSSRYWTI